MQITAVIDDRHGLYTRVSDAFLAGKLDGRQELYFHAMKALSLLSAELEKSGNVEGFRTAEAACAALRRTHLALVQVRDMP